MRGLPPVADTETAMAAARRHAARWRVALELMARWPSPEESPHVVASWVDGRLVQHVVDDGSGE